MKIALGADHRGSEAVKMLSDRLRSAGHEVVGYPYRRFTQFQIVAQVDAALASGDRQTILALPALLDEANNLGCPLNNSGN